MKTFCPIAFFIIVCTHLASAQCSVTANVISDVLCNGDCNGVAVANASGGTPPYTYTWIPSSSTGPTASGLCAGPYGCVISDAVGCTASSPLVIINQPPPLTTSICSQTNVTCHGESSGCLIVCVSGGTPAYTYSWSPPGLPANDTLCGISAGTYTMFVTDANGCTATVSGTVTEPPPIIPGICSQTNVTCYGDSNGCATACASNGIFPYTYEWSTGDTGTTICNLHPGQYSVIVYDANGCSADTFITITQPAPFFSTVCESNPPLCNQSADGCAVVCASGGTPNYTYTWLPTGGTGPTACGLTAGEYTCTVIDGNGCTFVSTVDIVQPNPITLSLSPTNASCSSCCDGSVTATAGGGTGQLYFIWTPSGDTGAIAAGLCPGINTCCVSDDNGCIACASDTVSFSNSVTDISFGSHLISVIPNPFTNELTITWNKGTGGRKDLSLFDITSKEILRRETSEEEIILHTENLATGFYLLRVGGENYKVVKEE